MFFSSSNRACASALASSVLPTPVGPRNRKLPMGRFGFAMPARERRIASGDLLHGLVLADDPLMQRVRQAEQLLAFAFDELGDRDAGPAGDDVRNFFFRYAVTKQAGFFLCFGQLFFFLQLLLQGGQLAVLQLTGLGVVAGAGRLFRSRPWWIPPRRAGSAPCSRRSSRSPTAPSCC